LLTLQTTYTAALELFQSTASQPGLQMSAQKTKAQNLGAGEPISINQSRILKVAKVKIYCKVH